LVPPVGEREGGKEEIKSQTSSKRVACQLKNVPARALCDWDDPEGGKVYWLFGGRMFPQHDFGGGDDALSALPGGRVWSEGGSARWPVRASGRGGGGFSAFGNSLLYLYQTCLGDPEGGIRDGGGGELLPRFFSIKKTITLKRSGKMQRERGEALTCVKEKCFSVWRLQSQKKKKKISPKNQKGEGEKKRRIRALASKRRKERFSRITHIY